MTIAHGPKHQAEELKEKVQTEQVGAEVEPAISDNQSSSGQLIEVGPMVGKASSRVKVSRLVRPAETTALR